MNFRLHYLIPCFVLLFVTWAGHSSYRYFFDHAKPMLQMSGLEDDGCYAGDIACHVRTSKKGYMSVWLDNQPLITNYWLTQREGSHPFIIPSKTIANGKHNLKIELLDSSYHKNKTQIERPFFVDNTPLQAAFVRTDADNKVFQGRTLHMQFQVNKEIKSAKVRALSGEFPCYPESKNSSIYECYIPVSCEEVANEYLLSIDIQDKVGNSLMLENKFQVVAYPFKKQNLLVSAEKVQQEKELGLDMDKLEAVVLDLIGQSPQEKLWKGAFINPIDVQKVTCEFGTIRTTQEKGRYMHKGVDLINAPRSVVWAPQDGVVVHKERYAFSGNTVIIDHGFGIISMFFHLDSISDIKLGQKITKGCPIGTIGKTGYATGYHLHWEMRVNNIQIDPMQWTKVTF